MKVIIGNNDNNLDFADLLLLLERFGFTKRVKGSHQIFYKEGVDEIINLQPKKNKAKAFQVKQVRELLIKYIGLSI